MYYAIPETAEQYVGPEHLIPAGAVLMQSERPTPDSVAKADGTWWVRLGTAKAAKLAAIRAGHDAALAGVVAISDPTPTTVAVEAALLAATDLAGLEYARQKLATRRAELLAAVNAATTVEVLDAVVVSYPV